MKRTWMLASLAIFCLAAVWLTPVVRAHLEEKRRQDAEAQYEKTSPRLVLDAKTQAILFGADRVETFRLAGGDMDYTLEEQVALSGPHIQYLDDYTVLHVGPPQGKAFAIPLRAAVAQATADIDAYQCFEPVIGFRAWKGKAHTDICVCFFCAGIEVITQDAHNHIVHQTRINLGAARPAFLALSKQAFPQDATLAALK
jgi:hypothetical protein